MWRRLRSRSMAPRRPAVFREQWPLVVLTAVLLLAGLAFALWALLG